MSYAERRREDSREWFETVGRELLGCLPGCAYVEDDSEPIGFATDHADGCPRAAQLAADQTQPERRAPDAAIPTRIPLRHDRATAERPYRGSTAPTPGAYRNKDDVRATARYLKLEVEHAGVMDGTEPLPGTHRAVLLGMFDKIVEGGLDEIAFSKAEAAERARRVPGFETLSYWSARKALDSKTRHDHFEGPVRPKLTVNQEAARRQRAARGGHGRTANFYRMRGVRDSRNGRNARAVFAAYPPFGDPSGLD